MHRSLSVAALVAALASTVAATAAVMAQAPSGAPNDAAAEQPWVAYWKGTGGTWLIHPDGTDDHRVAPTFPGQLILADWTPDGASLVMTSRDTGGAEPLYRYDLLTGEYGPIFPCVYPCLTDDEPNVARDGRRVVFSRALGPFDGVAPADCGIWVGDLTDGSVSQLTSNEHCDREYAPRWSPDGSQIAYWRWREVEGTTTGTAIFVMDADGTSVTQLTEWQDMAAEPDWSPDGTWLVHSRNAKAEPTANVFRMHPDGSGVEQLTFASGVDNAAQPRYTPDGRSILITAWRPGKVTTSVMPADGGDAVPISDDSTHGTWQPRPSS